MSQTKSCQYRRAGKLGAVTALLFASSLSGCTSDRAAAPERTLAVNVLGSVSVAPTTFSGHFVYEDSAGAEVRRHVSGSGHFNEIFQGERVLLVSVRRTSPEGIIGLVVTSDGDIVYDSGVRQTDELIVYKAGDVYAPGLSR